jgi:putative endopeptidase
VIKCLTLFAAVSFAFACSAQKPASAPAPEARPLTAMPYSPSLDVANMDKTVDPCVDFYKYTCGGWMKANPIPADQSSWSVYGKLATENQQFLWGILEEDAKLTKRNAVQQKVGDYFESCMNTAAIDGLGASPILPVLSGIDSLTTRKELIDAITYLDYKYSGTFFFNPGTDQDASDSSTIIVEVGAGGLGLPDRDYYLKTDAKSVKIREQYVAYIEQLLALTGESADKAKMDADAVLKIETALAKASLTRIARRDPHNTYHMLTVAELTALTPSIDWTKVFAKRGATNILKLNVEQPEFMKAVESEITTEDLAALRAYLRFHVLTAAAPVLAHPFEQANFDFYSHTLRGTPQMAPRWKTCTRAVDRHLGEALGQEFVARTFSADTKAKTLLMTEQIETAMQHEIENLAWMSPETKKEALRKLHAVRNKIGYPDKWRDYSTLEVKPDDYAGNSARAFRFEQAREWNKLGKPVDRNEWDMTPPTVNAYYNDSMNDINFPAGVLQPPLYDPKEDDAPNYGQTGATIGHELTHAFDDNGRQFDWQGNLHDWWTPADAKGFEDRINCIRDQYAQFVIVDDIKIQSKLTSGEDVADVGGTMLAYIAWKMQTADKKLHDIQGFTPDQRFWIAMGQWDCNNTRPEDERVNALTNPHSPGYARINGVVSNMPEFQKAFGCKVGQPMVHTPTCRVW